MGFEITKIFGPKECWSYNGGVFYPFKKNKLCKETNEKYKKKMKETYLKSKKKRKYMCKNSINNKIISKKQRKYTYKNSINNKLKTKKRGGYRETDLIEAIETGNLEIIKNFFSENEFKIDNKIKGDDGDGYTPLHYACLRGQYNLVSFFIEKGANLDVQNFSSESILHTLLEKHFFYSESKLLNLFELLLKKGINTEILNENGDSALYCSILENSKLSLNLVKLLLKYDANPNNYNDINKPIIGKAYESNNYEICKLLINSGVHIPKDLIEDSTHKIDKYLKECYDFQESILSKVYVDSERSINNNDENINFFLKGLLVNDDDYISKVMNVRNFDGDSIPHIVCYMNYTNSIETLIKFYRIWETNRNSSDKTPLYHIVEHNNLKILQILIKKGCNLRVKNRISMVDMERVGRYISITLVDTSINELELSIHGIDMARLLIKYGSEMKPRFSLFLHTNPIDEVIDDEDFNLLEEYNDYLNLNTELENYKEKSKHIFQLMYSQRFDEFVEQVKNFINPLYIFDENGNSLIHIASSNSQLIFIDYLLKEIPKYFNILNLKNDKNQNIMDVSTNETVIKKIKDHIRFVDSIKGHNYMKRKSIFKQENTVKNKKLRSTYRDITGNVASFLTHGGYVKKTKKSKITKLKQNSKK